MLTPAAALRCLRSAASRSLPAAHRTGPPLVAPMRAPLRARGPAGRARLRPGRRSRPLSYRPLAGDRLLRQHPLTGARRPSGGRSALRRGGDPGRDDRLRGRAAWALPGGRRPRRDLRGGRRRSEPFLVTVEAPGGERRELRGEIARGRFLPRVSSSVCPSLSEASEAAAAPARQDQADEAEPEQGDGARLRNRGVTQAHRRVTRRSRCPGRSRRRWSIREASREPPGG